MSNDPHALRFDGVAIDLFAGKFSGTFDLEEKIGAEHDLDREVYFVVRSSVRGAGFTTTKSGDLRRTNVYEVAGVTTVPPEVGFQLQATGHAQLVLDVDYLSLDEKAGE